jgi:hypothetical protein
MACACRSPRESREGVSGRPACLLLLCGGWPQQPKNGARTPPRGAGLPAGRCPLQAPWAAVVKARQSRWRNVSCSRAGRDQGSAPLAVAEM